MNEPTELPDKPATDRLTLDHGVAVFVRPARTEADEVDHVEAWFAMIVARLRRRAAPSVTAAEVERGDPGEWLNALRSCDRCDGEPVLFRQVDSEWGNCECACTCCGCRWFEAGEEPAAPEPLTWLAACRPCPKCSAGGVRRREMSGDHGDWKYRCRSCYHQWTVEGSDG